MHIYFLVVAVCPPFREANHLNCQSNIPTASIKKSIEGFLSTVYSFSRIDRKGPWSRFLSFCYSLSTTKNQVQQGAVAPASSPAAVTRNIIKKEGNLLLLAISDYKKRRYRSEFIAYQNLMN
jgi:hypothetical protein